MKATITEKSHEKIVINIDGECEIFWSFGDGFTPSLSDRSLSNFILRSCYPIAMKKGVDLEVDFAVDGVLMRNMIAYGEMWKTYRPDEFKYVPKIKSREYYYKTEGNTKHEAFVAAFSGGVDSSYVLSKHGPSSRRCEFPPISAAVMVNGFGFGRDDDYILTYNACKEFCEHLEVDLLSVKTNWRYIVRSYETFHTLGLAAILGLLQDEYAGAYIALDFSYAEEFELGPWGNTTNATNLYHSSDFSFIPAGGASNRAEKINKLSEIGYDRFISVCNERGRNRLNCGKCEKCQRTLLFYRALNLKVPDENFEFGLDVKLVEEIVIKKRTQFIFYKSLERVWLNKDDPLFLSIKNIVSRAYQTGKFSDIDMVSKVVAIHKNEIRNINEAHKIKIKKIQDRLQRMKSSKSWKITKPLRIIRKKIHF